MDVSLTNEVKRFLGARGVDLVKVASVDRFEGAPERHHPKDMLPNVRSVVSFACHIPDTIMERNLRPSVMPYMMHGYQVPSRILDLAAFDLAKLLEERGYATLPLPSTKPQDSSSAGYESDISQRHAAVAAGLGEFGLCYYVVTPQYGPRVRLQAVLTSAPLAPDPMLAPGSVCDRCGKCVEACPVRALEPEPKVEIKLGENVYVTSTFNRLRCWLGVIGAFKAVGGYDDYIRPEEIRRFPQSKGLGMTTLFSQVGEVAREAAEKIKAMMVHPKYLAQTRDISLIGIGAFCGICMRECTVGREAARARVRNLVEIDRQEESRR